MRLLNVETRKLQEFVINIPRYAILSHTWGDDEVTFQDLERPDHTKKRGYTKINGLCCLAAKNGFEWVWVDTCCIDKTSSAELSEAINSMFRWYKESHICYAYLEDIQPEKCPAYIEDDKPHNDLDRVDYEWPSDEPEEYDFPAAFVSHFGSSRWFTRGWTLQELLAPKNLYFFNAAWKEFGTRSTLAHRIESITSIPARFLRKHPHPDFRSAKVAVRMSWAARRQTTRVEDVAYSLLGIFDVNMPMLYGEGERSFERLQTEILKQASDDSILAWARKGENESNLERPQTEMMKQSSDESIPSWTWKYKGKPKPVKNLDGGFGIFMGEGVLAQCPDDFAWWTSTQAMDFYEKSNFSADVTTRGLRVTLPVLKSRGKSSYGVLNCMVDNNFDQILAVRLYHTDVADEYERETNGLVTLSWQTVKKCQQTTFCLLKSDQQRLSHERSLWNNWRRAVIRIQGPDDWATRLVKVESESYYQEEGGSIFAEVDTQCWSRILLHYKKIPVDGKQDNSSNEDGFVVVLDERTSLRALFSLQLEPPPFICYTMPVQKGVELEHLISDNQHGQLHWHIPRNELRDLSKLRNSFSLKAGVPQAKIEREKFLDQERFLVKISYTQSLAQYATPITRTITNLRPRMSPQWARGLHCNALLIMHNAFIIQIPYIACLLNSKRRMVGWKETLVCEGLMLLNILIRSKACLTLLHTPMAPWNDDIEFYYQKIDLVFAVLFPFSMYTLFPRSRKELKVNPVVSVLCSIAILKLAMRGRKLLEDLQ
ncbi:HET domain-containing protein [Colletotrichum lupini]|uniref:HET domain-containing protein n=1 Tax=Colletotrichum lupini TaxID=145971 RepID=A0A9Q8SLI8_9PEZI|nr:HET domain-containing protein [Colletotrichum lupini]UQC78662.1 HET domain-containing protein [Colletotrichum lupini]